MPTPLPTSADVLVEPPSASESAETARGVASAVAPPDGLTDLQRILLETLFKAMTGNTVQLRDFRPMSASEMGDVLRRRNLQFRTRGVQVMLLAALILRPLPQSVVERVGEFANELGVDEGLISVARGFAAGSLGLAAVDFERNGYTADWAPTAAAQLHTSKELKTAWESTPNDPGLAQRWSDLGELAPGTLGRGVFNLYLARGFSVPGTPDSAPPLLAQHDWVHVLADFGTTVESELEVFAFIARANDDMRAFSLLAMVISLFETGYLRSAAGLFESSTGHISTHDGVATRIADAMRRGALCRDEVLEVDSIDYLRLDWFSVADQPIDEIRRRFRVVGKSDEAIEAGSVGPWELGGISPFQMAAGQLAAARGKRPYASYGAVPEP
jgi:hypothetical protein